MIGEEKSGEGKGNGHRDVRDSMISSKFSKTMLFKVLLEFYSIC